MFTKKDLIYDVLMKDKSKEKIFRQFGIRCFGWGGALFKSIGDACREYKIDIDKLLTELNKRRQ